MLDAPVACGDAVMAKCDVCGNDYDKAFQVVSAQGSSHTFDSFECAIHALAPTCAHCHCKIIGHGIEARGTFYCCAHCAKASGVSGVDDRV
jgi:hypothetical protein